MSFAASSSRYVPHSDATREHYEQLLLDLRRCLPPGVDDDIEEIASETLAIVRDGGGALSTNSSDVAQEQQTRRLELLFGTKLSRESLSRFLRYGKLIDDYVVAVDAVDGMGHQQHGGSGADGGGGASKSILELNYYEAPLSSSDEDAEDAEMALLSGVPIKKQHVKSAREDKSLMQYAFEPASGGADGMPYGELGAMGGGHMDEDEDGDELYFGEEKPKVTFNEVACNPQYIHNSLRRLFPSNDIPTCEAQALRVVEYLSQRSVDQMELDTQLTAYLGGYDDEAVAEWIADVTGSRWNIVYGLRYAQCEIQTKKKEVMDAMQAHAVEDPAVERLYQDITGKEVGLVKKRKKRGDGEEEEDEADEEEGEGGASALQRQVPLRKVDLQVCAFQDERTPHLHVRPTVPQGTQTAVYETHDELVLPPSQQRPPNKEELVRIAKFPEWARPVFQDIETLNPMQSKVYDCAFESDENMLVSAPTGAGKTNVAMMAMLRAISNARNANTGEVHLRDLTMVYVAPMKALVQEVVRTFSARLEPLGLTVAELSGDSAMNQQQMMDTQLIVTTPEKWDIVTRKSVELGVASLIKLLIIDEVHLLHNERGPVLEAIVARTMLQQQLRGEAGIRIVGLSATLPNYEDVSAFLQVDRQRGLYVFDSSYRPIPLEQTYCAARRIKGVNQATVMNRIVYDKVLQTMYDNEQVMIFVHSRKETEYTAMFVKQRALAENRQHHFVYSGGESERVLRDTVTNMGSELRRSLQELIPFGFAVHHAGLSREERQAVEELFANRHVRVLVCTSTLAWGVNLPANCVIIKGTRVFNGAKGESELLSALDVLQMFGRAGRVGFGSTIGRAAIITSPEDLHYYLSVLNQQLPIESQMMKRVVDMLNAEINLGHVESTREGVQWLQRTYLYVRMRKVPEVYGIRATASDPLLLHHLENIVHTACEVLRESKMIEYDPQSRKIASTPYGRIASYCYVTAASMALYLANLTPAMQDVDLFRTFALSSEFTHISVRAEEKAQMKELLGSAPIAVRESRETPLAKINILLQCYISRKDLEGLPLMSELVYIKDSAQRILRALYEICLVREYGRTARQFLELYTMVLHRQWSVQSPIRQVSSLLRPKDYAAILPALERMRGVPWEDVRTWSREDLAEKLSDDRRAGDAYECIRHVPHYVIEAAVRPLTRSMLYVDVAIQADFAYSERLHGRSVRDLLITVEHTNGRILHCEPVQLDAACLSPTPEDAESFECARMVVPVVDPRPTHLVVRCTSPNWLSASAMAAVPLLNTLLPPVAVSLREVHQRPPTEKSEDREVGVMLGPYALAAAGEKIFTFEEFSALQSDLVSPIMETRDSLFVGVPPGAGKTALAELFALQFLLECALEETQQESKAEENQAKERSTLDKLKHKFLYLTCHGDVANRRCMEWQGKFGRGLGVQVARLDRTQAPRVQRELLERSTLIVTTGADLLPLVRRADPALLGVTHICADHLHVIRASEGRWMEECLARLTTSPLLVAGGGNKRARLLALSYPLISCAEVCRWLRVSPSRQYNYGGSYRQLRCRMVAMDLPGARSRYEAGVVAALKHLQRPAYAAVPSVVFVPYTRNAEEVARRVLLRVRGFIPEKPATFVVGDAGEEELPSGDDPRLDLYLAAGVGYLHQGTTDYDLGHILMQLERPAQDPRGGAAGSDEESGAMKTTSAAAGATSLPLILVCTFDAAYRLPAALFANAIVCSAERVSSEVAEGDAGASSSIPATLHDCTSAELLQMTSRAANEAVVHCRPPRSWVLGQLLSHPLPLESSMCYPADFFDAVNAAVAQGRAKVKTDVLRVIKSHYFLNHLMTHLHFYGVPSAEDIPLYASEMASSVLAGLQELGCVDVLRRSAGGGEEDDDDDPLAPVRPTARGLAIAHHSVISMSTIEALTERMREEVKTGRLNGVSAMWRLVCETCMELRPTYLGESARVADGQENRVLHTIARALPAKFGVQYVNLDFSAGHTKVLLLILAHCARFFDDEGGSADGMLAAGSGHLFQHAQLPQDTLNALLLAVPAPVAARLGEDCARVLPTILSVVTALVELLDPTHARQARYLMHLSQCLHRRVWPDEPALVQLPSVQALLVEHAAGATDAAWQSLSLAELQSGEKEAVRTLSGLIKKHHVPRGRASETEAAVAARVLSESRYLPRTVSLKATGSIANVEIAGSGDGALAFTVHVSAVVSWAGPPVMGAHSWRGGLAAAPRHNQDGEDGEADAAAHDQETAEEEHVSRWWVACFVVSKEGGGTAAAKLLAIRAVDAQPSSASSLSSLPGREYLVEGSLLFPLTAIEEEDLNAVEVYAAITSFAFREDAETAVVFEAVS